MFQSNKWIKSDIKKKLYTDKDKKPILQKVNLRASHRKSAGKDNGMKKLRDNEERRIEILGFFSKFQEGNNKKE